jgi:uncharacterized protein YbgA (DUF1722 family)
MSDTASAPIRIGVSACLLGEKVRFDGGHKRHTNVLQHMVGYFSKQLDSDLRQELPALLEDYRAGLVPLVVPLTLIRHYVRKYDVTYLRGQVYLEPHPKELMLRNHV